MSRPTKATAAANKISGIIRWADQQQFANVAAELRAALSLLEADAVAVPPTKRRKRGVK